MIFRFQPLVFGGGPVESELVELLGILSKCNGILKLTVAWKGIITSKTVTFTDSTMNQSTNVC